MEQLFLSGIDIIALLDKIDQVIDKKLREYSKFSPTENSPEFISRSQVAKLLKISLPTLHDWTKLGRLKSYKIGNRVLYRQDEVIASIPQVSSFKHKKDDNNG